MKIAVLLTALVFMLLGCGQRTHGKCLLETCPQNGHIVYQYPDGSIYDGEALNGKAWGRGRVTDCEGFTLEGDFVDGEISGRGVINSPGGLSIATNFTQSKPTGKFYAVISGGSSIALPGQQKGYIPVGVTISGQWVGGKPILDYALWDDGRSYAGELDGTGKRLGRGVTTYIDGRVVCGIWGDAAPVIKLTPDQFSKANPVSICKP